MPSYTRKITINGDDFSAEVQSCSFTWSRESGCDTASLTINNAAFDDFMDIEMGMPVVIYYDTGVPWWSGVVTELQTSIQSGLSIQCMGTKTVLAQIYPTGRFGDLVETKAPDSVMLTADTDEGTLTGTYYYWVSSIDEKGETLATATTPNGVNIAGTGEVTLEWEVPQGATAFRIYRCTTTPYINGVYFDTSEPLFIDDGSQTGTAKAALPSSSTATKPSITSVYVKDVVNYLLDEFLPDDYSKGDITAGEDTELDDYDLTAASASLLEVLQALADIVGDVVWGMDEHDAVFFIPKSETVVYNIKQYTGTAKPTETNILVNATRKRTRDGVTVVKAEGEEQLEDPQRNKGSLAAWDSTTLPIQKRGYYEFAVKRETVHAPIIYDTDPELPWTKAEMEANYPTLESWLTDFPTLRWIYVMKDGLSEAFVNAYLQRKVQRVPPMGNVGYIVRGFPGVKTIKTAGRAASNFAAKFPANPDTWTLNLEIGATLIKPGQGLLRLTTDEAKKYQLEVNKVTYSFDEIVLVSIECGDRQYEDEDKDNKHVVKNLSMRRVYPNTWQPYSG